MTIYINIFELVAFCFGLLALWRSRPKHIVTLVTIVGLTCLNELLSKLFVVSTPDKLLRYNIFSLIEMSAWLIYFSLILKGTKSTKWLILSIWVTVFIFSLIELFGYRGWGRFHTDSYRLYSVSIIVLSVTYLSKTITYNNIYRPVKDPLFWFCSGAMIFHAVFFIQLTIVNMKLFLDDPKSIIIFNILLAVANTFYYSFLCLGFYTSYKSKQQTNLPFSKM